MNNPSTLLLAGALLAAPAARAQWTANAAQNTAVRDVAGVGEVSPRTAPGPNGGTYVSWSETVTTGTNYVMRLQLPDVNGRPQFGAAGLLVSSQPQATFVARYDLRSDAAGNALLAFQDVRSGNDITQVVVYRISPTGQQLWGANGIQLLDATATPGSGPAIGLTSQGNVVVGWNASATADATHGTRLVPPTAACRPARLGGPGAHGTEVTAATVTTTGTITAGSNVQVPAASASRYAAPKAYSVTFGSSDFHPESNVAANTKALYSSGASDEFYPSAAKDVLRAPLHLPQGAVITNLTLVCYDGTSTDITLGLYALTLSLTASSSYTVLGTLTPTGAPGYTSATRTPGSTVTINNNNTYFLRASYPASTAALTITAVRVNYTVTQTE